MDLAVTRDILSHSGTVPGNPGHLVTLLRVTRFSVVPFREAGDGMFRTFPSDISRTSPDTTFPGHFPIPSDSSPRPLISYPAGRKLYCFKSVVVRIGYDQGFS